MSLLQRSVAATRRTYRHSYEAEDRDRVRADLFFGNDSRWRFKFAFMLIASVTIASMGLLANSAAVVIGAMLIAPLMTPVLALSYCIAIRWVDRAAAALATVVVATLGAIGLGAFWAFVLPPPGGVLSNQILSRTSPDARDLIVALAAGAAGTYATLRADSSAALPGVAVAVALVPPLAVVGITLEQGHLRLAYGALQLYLANLFAIMASGTIVFLVSGFARWNWKNESKKDLALRILAPIVLTIAVAIPLWGRLQRSIDAAQRAQRQAELAGEADTRQSALENTVRDWLDSGEASDFQIERVALNEESGQVIVDLDGTGTTPSVSELEAMLEDQLGFDVDVRERKLIRSERSPADEVPVPPSDEELFEAQLIDVVNDWLAGEPDEEYNVRSLSVSGDVVNTTIAGTATPPDLAELEQRIADATGEQYRARVEFIQTLRVGEPEPEPEPVPPTEEELVRSAATDWAEGRPLDVVGEAVFADQIVVDLAGVDPPSPESARTLVDAIRETLSAPDADIELRFLQRSPIEVAPPPTTVPLEDDADSTDAEADSDQGADVGDDTDETDGG